MSKSSTIAIVLVMLGILVATPVRSAPRTASDAVFRKLVIDRIRAYGRGDVAAYGAMLADGFVHVSDVGVRRTAKEMRAYVGGHDITQARYDIAELSWRLVGDVAVVDAAVHERMADDDSVFRETDVFVRRENRWLYLNHQETTVWQPPVPATAIDRGLAAYAGTYRSDAGIVDVITVERGTLYDRTLPSTVRAPFVPLAPGVFGFADDPTIAVFTRNGGSAISQCFWRVPSGHTLLSHRVR